MPTLYVVTCRRGPHLVAVAAIVAAMPLGDCAEGNTPRPYLQKTLASYFISLIQSPTSFAAAPALYRPSPGR